MEKNLTIMDHNEIPPPPYSESDPDALSSVILTPTTSDADSSNPLDCVPYDLDSYHGNLSAPSVAAYIASRPVSSIPPGQLATHSILVTAQTEPQDLLYPEPSQLFLSKDLTHYDWQVFVR
jgi:hypothetical protein